MIWSALKTIIGSVLSLLAPGPVKSPVQAGTQPGETKIGGIIAEQVTAPCRPGVPAPVDPTVENTGLLTPTRKDTTVLPVEIVEPQSTAWITEYYNESPFEKVGRIAMCGDGLAIYSDSDTRVFLLDNRDIDAVLEGATKNIRQHDTHKKVVGKAKVSTSGKALNITIGTVYYTTPLRFVLAVLDNRNHKGPLFKPR